jgi:transcriptional regulator with XRE-family HTH domain
MKKGKVTMSGKKGPRSPAALRAAKARAERELQLRGLFARRLEAALVEKGWNQSELARRATQCLPKSKKGQIQGEEIGRDLISHYLRAKIRPRTGYLGAIAKALGTTREALMPTSPGSAPPPPMHSPMKLEELEDGRVLLQINRVVSREAALAIVRLLQPATV